MSGGFDYGGPIDPNDAAAAEAYYAEHPEARPAPTGYWGETAAPVAPPVDPGPAGPPAPLAIPPFNYAEHFGPGKAAPQSAAPPPPPPPPGGAEGLPGVEAAFGGASTRPSGVLPEYTGGKILGIVPKGGDGAALAAATAPQAETYQTSGPAPGPAAAPDPVAKARAYYGG